MRTVSALSAACLAMRRADFIALGGFDEVNTPIAHSDVDLCFKVREAGMLVLVRDRKQMGVKRDPVACP